MSTWDAIVVGGGHNGLAAAAVLAKTGRKTLVLEARAETGGLCAGEEFHPGYRHTGLHHDTDLVRPWLVETLELARHGLELKSPAPVFLPLGQGLLFHRDPGQAKAELEPLGDADGYRALVDFAGEIRSLVAMALDAPAPALGRDAPLWPLAQQALRFRWMGGARMLELARVMVLSAEDWLSENLKDRRLRAAIALGSLIGTWMGPRSPQSAGMVLLRTALAGSEVVGGAARFAQVLERAARQNGAEVRCSCKVERIVVERGAVKGALVGGELLDAPIVVSGLDPKRTLLQLVAPGDLPAPLEDEVRTVRARATSAKLYLALSRAPAFSSREGIFERFRVVEDTHQIERAFDHAKYGRLPSRPPLEVHMPTAADPTLAPLGHHVLSVHVFGVPYALEGGWTDAARSELLQSVLALLGEADPGIASAVVGTELLVPPDIEVRYGATGGHLMHGEHALDQLWVGRPGRATSGHATSIRGLFLGSGGTHPMGGATGAPGAFAARRALEGA